MGAYAYKQVRDRIPPFVTDAIEAYEGGCGYDGDQWIAAANYIDRLEAEIARRPAIEINDTELRDWLTSRPRSAYGGPRLVFAR